MFSALNSANLRGHNNVATTVSSEELSVVSSSEAVTTSLCIADTPPSSSTIVARPPASCNGTEQVADTGANVAVNTAPGTTTSILKNEGLKSILVAARNVGQPDSVLSKTTTTFNETTDLNIPGVTAATNSRASCAAVPTSNKLPSLMSSGNDPATHDAPVCPGPDIVPSAAAFGAITNEVEGPSSNQLSSMSARKGPPAEHAPSSPRPNIVPSSAVVGATTDKGQEPTSNKFSSLMSARNAPPVHHAPGSPGNDTIPPAAAIEATKKPGEEPKIIFDALENGYNKAVATKNNLQQTSNNEKVHSHRMIRTKRKSAVENDAQTEKKMKKDQQEGSKSRIIEQSQFVRCGKCRGCVEIKNCGLCSPCSRKRPGTCIFRPCDLHPDEFKNILKLERQKFLRLGDKIEVGTRVYALWPETNEWYWGHVTKLFKAEKVVDLRYDVQFEDGDYRVGVPSLELTSQASKFYGEEVSDAPVLTWRDDSGTLVNGCPGVINREYHSSSASCQSSVVDEKSKARRSGRFHEENKSKQEPQFLDDDTLVIARKNKLSYVERAQQQSRSGPALKSHMMTPLPHFSKVPTHRPGHHNFSDSSDASWRPIQSEVSSRDSDMKLLQKKLSKFSSEGKKGGDSISKIISSTSKQKTKREGSESSTDTHGADSASIDSYELEREIQKAMPSKDLSQSKCCVSATVHKKTMPSLSARRELSSTLDVDSRCYVVFNRTDGHWCRIVAKDAGRGRRKTVYSFRLETTNEIKTTSCKGLEDVVIWTEKDYAMSVGDPGVPRYNPRELYIHRCRQCALCLARDCGKCKTCLFNRSNTTSNVQVCFRKMCQGIKEENMKGQPVDGLPGWFFICTNPLMIKNDHEKVVPPRHKGLDGLYFYNPMIKDGGMRVRGYESTPEMKRLPESERKAKAQSFYIDTFGVRVMKEEGHKLVGCMICQEWIGPNGRTLCVYGEIKKCERDFGDDGLEFTVEYNEVCRVAANLNLASLNMSVPKRQQIPLSMALGGYLLFLSETSTTNRVDHGIELPAHEKPLRWIVPHSTALKMGDNGLPTMYINVRGFVIILKVRQSTIPDAGLGVFAKCFAASSLLTQQEFVLEPGELVDIGLYAPLRGSDKKSESIAGLKNFLLKGKSQSWQFDCHENERDRLPFVFDFTNDVTGELETWSRHSIPSYVNETNGVENPTVHAHYDPSGGVHYLMGHENDKPFRLPQGVTVELKIDYGEKYERVRVVQGYPRVSRDGQMEIHQEIEKEYFTFIDEIPNSSANEIIDDVHFLSLFTSKLHELEKSTKERLLLASINIVARIKDMIEDISKADSEDICDNSLSRLSSADALNKGRVLIKKFVTSWSNPLSMQTDLCVDKLNKYALGKVVKNPDKQEPGVLYSTLVTL